MNEKQKLISRAEYLNAQIRDMETELNNVEDLIAEINCPFKIGDVIVNNDGKNAKVEAIKPAWNYDNYRLVVRRYRNNGQLYKNTNELWHGESWEVVK